ncbi:uncharacterized protein PFL1_05981 [Pseudozyma flocculosa PF-1]|uniref:Shq1 C-terminal domain-containing protein n=2 Tax=Pseudozyma flocculosa TaxID=84751 RepID=A0A5C3F3J9_9BASI|nr:uncharacterized protein PFL1_05981 [Pseudozyma flocculosa PF-1]EPQ26332.1 hypothetical protein PFL1_05981 [Pseudozyma flocculosa PF-1]SPO39083.1 uncharacterized protein PSFLO_04562 [Pseudozyma flocculosa]
MDGFLVPSYSIAQTPTSLDITITLPASAAAATSPHAAPPAAKTAVSSRIFAFHCASYYLPLVFPAPLVAPATNDVAPALSDDGASAVYTVHLLKGSAGLWDGLEALQPQLMPDDEVGAMQRDMEAKQGLFAPDDQAQGQPIASGTAADRDHDNDSDRDVHRLLQRGMTSAGLVDLDAPASSKPLPSTAAAPSSSHPASSQAHGHGYGFRSAFTGPLVPGGEADVRNILEVSDPASVPPSDRALQAEAYEEQQWDEGIYLDNYLDFDGEMAALVSFRPPIVAAAALAAADAAAIPSTTTTGSLDDETASVLVQLLFGYLYEMQANYGETTVESSWTIAKLSRTLCSASLPLEPTSGTRGGIGATMPQRRLLATLRATMRRALVVPLYRHWHLSLSVLSNVVALLRGGKAHVLPVLASISDLFQSDPVGTAVLARLDEVWVRPLSQRLGQLSDQAADAALSALADEVQSHVAGGCLDKRLVGGETWDIEVSEQAARLAVEQGEGGFV